MLIVLTKGLGSRDQSQTKAETEEEVEIHKAGVNRYNAEYKSVDHYNKKETVSPASTPPFSHLYLSLSIPSSLHPNQSLPPPSLMHSFMSSPISPPLYRPLSLTLMSHGPFVGPLHFWG